VGYSENNLNRDFSLGPSLFERKTGLAPPTGYQVAIIKRTYGKVYYQCYFGKRYIKASGDPDKIMKAIELDINKREISENG